MRKKYVLLCLLIGIGFLLCFYANSSAYVKHILNIRQKNKKHPSLDGNDNFQTAAGDTHSVAGSTNVSQIESDGFPSRRTRLQHVCSAGQVNKHSKDVPELVLDDHSGLLYCIVNKAGCTFWKAIMKSLKENKHPTSKNTFSAKIEQIHSTRSHISRRYSNPNVYSDDKYPVRFLVARDPFSRLLSGYIDKFYFPENWHKFNTHGYRPDLHKTASRNHFFENHFKDLADRFPAKHRNRGNCRKDVTFAQFVDFSFHHGDTHWMSMQQACQPCAMNFTHVVSMRTFMEDSRAILAHTSGANLLDDFDLEEPIRREAEFQLNRAPQTCASVGEIAQRVWNDFIWRGYIHPKIDLKLNEKIVGRPMNSEVNIEHRPIDVVLVEFFRQFDRARAAGLKAPHLMKEAKEEFKRNAFQSLPEWMFDAIMNKYKDDFKMFDFDREVEKVKKIMLSGDR